MIFVTGDIHAQPDRFANEAFPEQKEMTKDDYVIICGDFGFVSYKQWMFGHYHENKRIDALDDVLYEQIVRIG